MPSLRLTLRMHEVFQQMRLLKRDAKAILNYSQMLPRVAGVISYLFFYSHV